MKAFMTTLVGVLTIGAVGLAATSALACHGGGGYGGYSSRYSPRYVERVYVKEQPVVVAPTFAPAHSRIVVMPGDSWFSICSREYGNTSVWSRIAEFNGIPQNMPLNGGMQLRLPVINPNGSFSLSSAPAAIAMAPQGFGGGFPQGLPQGTQRRQQGGMPQATGFAPQGQGFAQQQLPNGLTQGAQVGPQGGMPQANGFGPQDQGFAPQQGLMGLPQGVQAGPQSQPVGPQAPIAGQAPNADAKNAGMVGQRIADQLTGLPGDATGQPAPPNAGPSDRPLPSILIGSIMTINGQPLGENRGTVRLIVNGSPVALEIVEWSANGAKVRIPADLPAGLQAQIEILRADGSLVAKDAVQLAAGQKVAAAN
jgi:nucleoid-associated protein YgaU